ncbi:helix-turn-helix domain-containing protein [Microvirga makkahensis]|uniref:HTH crp-type domain-containing protein n=1 Tax=Microvirga makkahensis TaxID=1128670 RepID=A0A7X3SRX2_9HYPH|nr:hypothetical protein [Microvirga makkahensis]
MTGTTLYTVSRILSAREEQGFVESVLRRIGVCDPRKLFMLVES